MAKKGKIASITYTKDWKAPDNTILYYHVVLFENGESGSCALKSKNQYDIGDSVEYELNGDKLRILSKSSLEKPIFNSYKKSTGSKKPEDYLGFVYGYAKDIHIARMQISQNSNYPLEQLMEDVERMYQHVQNLLNS